MIVIKSKAEVAIMRDAGRIVASVLLKLKDLIKPGVSTNDLDVQAERSIRDAGAIPTFIGYQGYPKSLCTSINEEVVHGIPGNKRLKEGDIIGIDCGVTYKGFVADHAMTFSVGRISEEYQRLMDISYEALMAGIKASVVGNRIGDIGYAVQSVAQNHSYGVVRDFVGHGVGRKMHEEPQVPNFGRPGTGPRIRPGMVIAIEPMFNLGTHEVEVLSDGWTVVTKDKKASAHFEHTISCTENGPEILTMI